MKVLFLVQKDQRAILDRLYEGVAAHCECDLRWLSSDEQRNLRRYFRREVDVTQYDRIVFFLRFKQEIRQVGFIRTIPNLVILEHDAYQNYIPCKYTGKYHDKAMDGVGPVRDMKSVHQDLQITNAMFNALAEDLQIAMEQHNVPSSVSNKLVAKLAPMQRDIVTK